MRERDDLQRAIASRGRSRSRVRAVTVAVGAAGLATAGLVAYTLPGPQTSRVANVTTNPTPSAQPTQVRTDDDGWEHEGDDQAPAPTQTPASGTTHVTSGGS